MSLTYNELQGKVTNTDTVTKIVLKRLASSKTKDEITFNAKTHLSLQSIIDCVENIITLLRENEYNFAYYPAIFTSCIVNTFTDLEIKDESGNIDIELVCALDNEYSIIDTLKDHSLIAPYIFQVEQNVWRQIDLDKQRFTNYGANTFFGELSDILYLLQDKLLSLDTTSIPEMLKAVDKITDMNKVFNTDYEGNKGKKPKK